MNSKISNKSLISVVVPAYQAEKFIEKNLAKVKSVLAEIRHPYEIICVDDGSRDKTFERAKAYAKKNKEVRVIGYEKNLGKGHAVRYGMSESKGDIVGFIDAGIELNPNGLSMLLEHMEWYKADIVVGSKRHPASKVSFPWQRKLLSLGYQTIVRMLFGLNVKDTQVGLKFFRKGVLKKVLPRLLVKEFAFDIEMLSVARHLGYTRIYEAPVEIKMEFKGGVSTIASKGFIKTVLSMFQDTLAVFYRLYILRYYDDKNRQNWFAPEYKSLKKKS